jgi:Bifunctional DNA primase/polymerase, N-terminal
MTDKLERARWWLRQGVKLLPCQPKSKSIVAGFGSRLRQVTTEPEAAPWWGERSANMAIVLGRGLVAADFDVADEYWRWVMGAGAGVKTYTELTARGAHVIFSGEGLPSGAGAGCEFKSSGAVLVAPSVHPSGILYRVLCDLPPQKLSIDEALSLFPFLAKPKPKSPKPSTPAAASGRMNMLDTIKSNISVVSELEAAGVRQWAAYSFSLTACCPFHQDEHPSLWAMPHVGVWGCNAPSCKAHGKHDVVNARALRRGITVPEAIREMWAEVKP